MVINGKPACQLHCDMKNRNRISSSSGALQHGSRAALPLSQGCHTPNQFREVAALTQPYRFIYRLMQRKKLAQPGKIAKKPPPALLKASEVSDKAKNLVRTRSRTRGLDEDAILNVHLFQNAQEQNRANLSDVDEAIRAVDPTFTMTDTYVQIVEEPAPKALRFRYECEGRSAGSIPGVYSTPDNKSYPTIKVCGYKGCMVIVVSCVTKDKPYKAHPHNLVGRECSMGVCTVKTKTEGDADYAVVPFKNLGIQCIKRKDIVAALKIRQDLRVDPYRAGFEHKNQPQSIDLNAVRLCFQVFLTDEAYRVQQALRPVVSDVIYDKKAMSDLLMVRTSHFSGPVAGNTTVILLCEKVNRDDIEVIFFHAEAGWEERGHVEFVHKQLALVFKTPPYRDTSITQPVKVQYQLRRVSDGAKSNVFQFEYVPSGQDVQVILGSKRKKKTSYGLEEYDDSSMEAPIKVEPIERTPPHVMSNPHQQQWAQEGLASAAYAGGGGAWGGVGVGAGAGSPQLQLLSPAPPSPHYQHIHSPGHQMQQQPGQMHMQHMQMQSRLSPQPSVSPHLMTGAPYAAAGPSYAGVSPLPHQGVSPVPHQGVSPVPQQGVSPVHQAMQEQPSTVFLQDPQANAIDVMNFEAYNQLSISGNLSAFMNPVDADLPLSDISGLSTVLNDDNLSGSFTRLSTKDERW